MEEKILEMITESPDTKRRGIVIQQGFQTNGEQHEYFCDQLYIKKVIYLN